MPIPPVTNAHKVSATDSSITLAWDAPVVAESPEGTLIMLSTDPPIIDSQGTSWNLSADNHILINGAIDSRTGTAAVVILNYHNHNVYQQNSKATWYYTANSKDSWHQTSAGPLVTHYTVQSELTSLKGMSRFTGQALTLYNQIYSDVGKLVP
jgi:hypothetical protein